MMTAVEIGPSQACSVRWGIECAVCSPIPPNLYRLTLSLPLPQLLPTRPHQQVFPQLQIGELLFVGQKQLQDRPIRQAGQPRWPVFLGMWCIFTTEAGRSRQNRQYVERYQIFHDHAYPVHNVEVDPESRLLQWTAAVRERKPELVRCVAEYFEQRLRMNDGSGNSVGIGEKYTQPSRLFDSPARRVVDGNSL